MKTKELTLNDVTIRLEMQEDSKVSEMVSNNISAFDLNNNKIWDISNLLKAYSIKNSLNYFEEVYFDIILSDDYTVKFIGFFNHCIVDVVSMEIIGLINNR